MTNSCDKCGADVVPKFRLTRISVMREPLWYHECTNCKKAFVVDDADWFYNNYISDVIYQYRIKLKVHAYEKEYV